MSAAGNLQPQSTSSPANGAYAQPAPGITLSAVEPYRDTQVTVQAGASAAAPTAGTDVATITPGTAGLWEVSGTVTISGTTVAATDSSNVNLLQTAASVLAAIPVAVSGTTGSVGSAAFGPLILNLSAADTVHVTAIANATASSKYTAQIVARRVG